MTKNKEQKISISHTIKSQFGFKRKNKKEYNLKDFFFNNSLIVGSCGTGKTQALYVILEELIKNKQNYIYSGIDDDSLIINGYLHKKYNLKNKLVAFKETEINNLPRLIDKGMDLVITSYKSKLNNLPDINSKIINEVFNNKKNNEPLFLITDEPFTLLRNKNNTIRELRKKNIFLITTTQSIEENCLENIKNFNDFLIFKSEDPYCIKELNNKINMRDVKSLRVGKFYYLSNQYLDEKIHNINYPEYLNDKNNFKDVNLKQTELNLHLMKSKIKSF
jgi:hypothetical protein